MTSRGSLRTSPTALPTAMDITCVGPDGELTRTLQDVSELASLRAEWPLLWLNVVGLGDAELVGQVGEAFDLHPLASAAVEVE